MSLIADLSQGKFTEGFFTPHAEHGSIFCSHEKREIDIKKRIRSFILEFIVNGLSVRLSCAISMPNSPVAVVRSTAGNRLVL